MTTVVGVAALVLVWVRFARGDTESAARFARYAAAAVVAFVAFGKVVSPQFLVWLLAVVVLVPGRRGVVATALLLVGLRAHPAVVPAHLLGSREAVRSDGVVARARPRPLLVGVFAVLVVRVRALRAREPEPA